MGQGWSRQERAHPPGVCTPSSAPPTLSSSVAPGLSAYLPHDVRRDARLIKRCEGRQVALEELERPGHGSHGECGRTDLLLASRRPRKAWNLSRVALTTGSETRLLHGGVPCSRPRPREGECLRPAGGRLQQDAQANLLLSGAGFCSPGSLTHSTLASRSPFHP